jgi:hypothetical protein
VIKLRRVIWAGHAARTGEGIGAYMILVGKPEGRRPLGISRRRRLIILKWIFKPWDGSMDCSDLAENGDRWRALVKYNNE